MQLLKDAGIRIPQDIAIVGFNNDSIGKVISPKLTTINYPGFEMGQMAARNLISHLKGLWDMNRTNTVVIKFELIIRESSLKKGKINRILIVLFTLKHFHVVVIYRN
jgi:LacI family transcriptional regulator, galactose operon repressor